MTLALSGRPGPVALIVPEDVLEERARTQVRRIDGSLPAARPQAPDRDLGDVARAIDRARRPALVAGGGVHLSDAHAQLARLAERAGIAVATTLHGKGAIGERSPLWLGTAGANGGRPYANRYLAEADLVLFVGTRANATDTDGFRSPPRQGCVVGHIDIDPARAGHNYPGSRALCGDARTVLARLAHLVSPAPERTEAIMRWIAAERGAWDKALASRRPPDGVLDPAAIVAALRTVLPDGTTVVADCGTPTPYLGAGWFMEQAGRRLLLPRGHGPMGYAYPAAVGAAFAVPGEPVLAITTDGSLLMAAGAMETAARLALPITYVQMTNGSLGWIKALQHLYFEGRSYSTGISRFDTVVVARGLGLEARRATTLEELCEAARASLGAGRPSLIDVPVPDEHVLLPPVAPWERAASTSGSDRPVY